MAKTDDLLDPLDTPSALVTAPLRAARRDFFRAIAGAALVSGTLALTGRANAQSGPTDADILNFALNLEYIEANFYAFAANGAAIPAAQQTGTGTQGAATGGRQVNFGDPAVRQIAREIAADEVAHVAFLRQALGNAAVAQPAIDLGVSPTSAFSRAAQAAGLVPAGGTFDPYASDDNFLLAAFLFEDVGVTAYKGAAPLISSRTFLEASAGILAVEAYHAAILRTSLFARGLTTPSLIDATEAISNARDSLDGISDLDQGIRPGFDSGNNQVSNIVPVDVNGLAFSRSPGQVLNIVYLNRAQTNRGGFLPAGANGALVTSAANG